MPRYGMVIDITKCNGCHNCFLACRDEYTGNDYLPYSVSQPQAGPSWMQIIEKERGKTRRSRWPLPRCRACIATTLCA